jgi:hypothetical protein
MSYILYTLVITQPFYMTILRQDVLRSDRLHFYHRPTALKYIGYTGASLLSSHWKDDGTKGIV